MNKKLIIITAGAGLISFAGMFTFGWLTKEAPPVQSSEIAQTAQVSQETGSMSAQAQIPAAGSVAEVKTAMTEKQLKELIYEVREKIREYDHKLQELSVREQNLQTAQETLKKDIEELDNLRIKLGSTVAGIKNEQDKLLKSRIEISNIEKKNLISIAATYDKMDSAQAGKILSNMGQVRNENGNDAVKILHYMSERTKAKVLAAIAETEPAISADFCQKLKQISIKE